MVRFCDGDGCVPVLDGQEGAELNYPAFIQFLSDCKNHGTYPLLCIEAARKAWVAESQDALDEAHLEYEIKDRTLYVRENV